MSFFAAWFSQCSDDGSTQQGDGHVTDEEAAHDDADATAASGCRSCSWRIQSSSKCHRPWWHGEPNGGAKHGPTRPPAVWLWWKLW